ncbi:MAG: inositol monophosphatase family protein [Dehalococcoidia bacterium]
MIEQVEDLMRGTATEAILPYFKQLSEQDVQEKSPGELVTIADQRAERQLTAGLLNLMPNSIVVGEESVAADPSLLQAVVGEPWVWIVDPLDGTANFVAGHGPFAMMVALLRNGKTVAACTLDPLKQVAATAEAGAGAFLNGTRVYTATQVPPLVSMRGAIYTRFLPVDLRTRLEARAGVFAEVLPGTRCCGFEYPAIVLGNQHFVLYWRTLPWDHLPGTFFIQEAGGVVRRLDGSPYIAGEDRVGLLAARNVETWETVHAALFSDEASLTFAS